MKLKQWIATSDLKLKADWGLIHLKPITSIALSEDDKFLFSGSMDKHLKQWDIEKQVLLHDFGEIHQKWVEHVVISPNGDDIYTSGNDKFIKRYSISKQKFIRQYGDSITNKKNIRCITCCSQGIYLFSSDEEKCMKQWNIYRYKLSKTYPSSNEFGTIDHMIAIS